MSNLMQLRTKTNSLDNEVDRSQVMTIVQNAPLRQQNNTV